MSTQVTYTVRPLAAPPGRENNWFGVSHGVYTSSDDLFGVRAIALCYSEADAQNVAAALNNYPAALGVIRKLNALNTRVHDWDEALRLDAEIRQSTAELLGLTLDSPAEKAHDTP